MSKKKLKILVIDDEEVIRNLLHSFITKNGHHSIAVSNGKEAIKIAAKQNFDIVLLDIKMPEMDGLLVCQQLRCLPSISSSTGIFMISGYGTLKNKEKAIEYGADDLVEKPLDLYELLYRIEVWRQVREIKDQMKRVATYAVMINQYHKPKS